MNKQFVKCVLLATTLSLLACSTPPTNQDVGTVTGGVIGGLVGSRFGGGSGQLLAIGAGTLVGAYVGSAIGKSMDDADRARMNAALENNAVGQPAYWQNPKTGTSYNVVPEKNVTVGSNQYCREYQTVANINGKSQKVYGTACRQPDGSWQMVSND